MCTSTSTVQFNSVSQECAETYYPTLIPGYWPHHIPSGDEFIEFGEGDCPVTWTRSLEEGKEADLAHFKEDTKPAPIYSHLLYDKDSGRNEEDLKMLREQSKPRKRKNDEVNFTYI